MKPRIITIDPLNINRELISVAAEVINNRGLVAFPTETVYGLGANALDGNAVAGIFEAKKRPLDDPLIVHISEKIQLNSLVKEIPSEAEKLIEKFWPGPLTIILEKSNLVPDIVTTGLKTVAVRMPRNPIAKSLIEESKVPIAAPSANLFSRPSPTIAAHVLEDLKGRIDIILDGGQTEIGIESTVIEFTRDNVYLLRPGGIVPEEIEKLLGKKVITQETGQRMESSPGKYPKHYSPLAEMVIVECSSLQSDKTRELAEKIKITGKSVGILAVQENENKYKEFDLKILGPSNDAKICAARLFRMLREFDAKGIDVIIAEAIPIDGIGLAVMNRLTKAAFRDSI